MLAFFWGQKEGEKRWGINVARGPPGVVVQWRRKNNQDFQERTMKAKQKAAAAAERGQRTESRGR